MEQLVQCPVCTLYLHNGMSLESHLDTHPKDQVIKALCTLSASKSNYGSRCSTPMHSERSYRSRSRTPAVDDNSSRWSSGPNNSEQERYWHRTPTESRESSMAQSRPLGRNLRTPTRSSRPSTSCTDTPSDLRIGDLTVENVTKNLPSTYPKYTTDSFSIKSDKASTTSGIKPPGYVFQNQYIIPDAPEETEIKYSRSAEYNLPRNTTNNVFAYNLQSSSSNVKLQMPSSSKRNNDYLNVDVGNTEFLIPKNNNVSLVKNNAGPVPYAPQRGKPVHLMLPPTQAFVQKAQNSIIMTTNVATSSTVHNKNVPTTILPTQFTTLTPNFAPNKTVVTQNSQLIYQEMVHSIDGKSYIHSVPNVLSAPQSMNNITQASSMYQNLMVVDPYGNASCVYNPPLINPQTTITFSQTVSSSDKTNVSRKEDPNKTLVIEIGPNLCSDSQTSTLDSCEEYTRSGSVQSKSTSNDDKDDDRVSTPGMKKGLKILSNIKVEVPVQHHKSMLNTIVDLTGTNDTDYKDIQYPATSIQDVDVSSNDTDKAIDCTMHHDTSREKRSSSFSVIKNVGKPPGCKETAPAKVVIKNDVESLDSSSVPDLICNEKPSVSPCSELSENGDNAIDHTPLAIKTDVENLTSKSQQILQKSEKMIPKAYWAHALRSNDTYVKKHKKVLQIKNCKYPSQNSTKSDDNVQPSCSGVSDNFNDHHGIRVRKLDSKVDESDINKGSLDANTEEQSMEIEPVAHTSFNQSSNFVPGNVQIKVEANNSNEMFNSVDNDLDAGHKELTPLQSMRPINVIAYNNMSDNFSEGSSHREYLDLETSKRQFANIINENYFGDNGYSDYFTAERAESFDTNSNSASMSKDYKKGESGMYLWNEMPQKENYVTNFIHDSYKIAENLPCTNFQIGTSGTLDRVEFGGDQEIDVDGDMCEQDSKLDVLSESRSESEIGLDICSDEKMPPRGELSGQESNGDMETAWPGIYPEVIPSEPYDLMARESWVSDGSDVDISERRDDLEEDLSITNRLPYACPYCEERLATLKELSVHRSIMHASTSAASATSSNHLYRRLTDKSIKKEEKPDTTVLTEAPAECKATITSDIYTEVPETKPKIEFIKKEPRKRRDYTCPTCKVDLQTELLFREHLKIHPLECLTCGKCFYKRTNLNLHIRTHLGIRKYKCEVCEKRFASKQKLQEHHNTHTGRSPFKCTMCDETFRRYSNMVQHRDRHHLHKKAKIRDYVCHCGEVFHSRAKLRWHAEIHEDRPKACPHCSDKFVHAASLTRHVRRAHNACYVPEGIASLRGAENVTCPICKQIYLRANLKTHLLTHSGKRPFVCIICNKAFTTKWNLKLHRWVHMSRSSKPFKCSLCKGAFIRQSEYVSHMNSHKSVRPYTCNYCGCQFIRKYNCQRHVKEHEMAKKYVCKVPDCGKSFHRSYYLTEHMRVHSGARPFSCNICGKTSSNKSNHNKHVKIHHAREPVATEA